MQQAYLEVAGLALDMVGVLLIAWEWLMAQRQEAAQRAIEQTRERTEAGQAMLSRGRPNIDPAMQRHFELVGEHTKRSAASRIEATRNRYSGMRVTAVAIGMVFVVAGFLLQLLGAWPGCCVVIGVIPAP